MPNVEKKSQKMEIQTTDSFIQSIVGKPKATHFHSRNSGISSPINSEDIGVSRFVMSLHNAFDKHIPFAISPEVIMSIISQEIAQYVKDHSEEKAIVELFTTSKDKQHIVVEVHDFVYGGSNDWLKGIAQFKDKLLEIVPTSTIKHMLPTFSNNTLETEVSLLVSFMDAASKYYSYGMMTCCGIPEFKIEGTSDDWNKICSSVIALKPMFPQLLNYFNAVLLSLNEIRNTVDGNKIDVSFWDSIYKIGIGSGGPYSNGWYNNFYAHSYDSDSPTLKCKDDFKIKTMFGTKLNQFPANISNVPFTWHYLGTDIAMSFVSGVTSVEMIDGFLTPKLGVSVLERMGK
jgi:hypothetical protein